MVNDENIAPQKTMLEQKLKSITELLYDMKQTTRLDILQLHKAGAIKLQMSTGKNKTTPQNIYWAY